MRRVSVIAAFAGLALSAAGPAAAQAAPSSVDGAAVFKQRCQACHALDRPATLAPSLAGVVGRKAGATSFQYSAALRGSGLTWTKSNLDKFLTGPTRMVPGTRMVVALPDSAQRAAVIAYLSSLR